MFDLGIETRLTAANARCCRVFGLRRFAGRRTSLAGYWLNPRPSSADTASMRSTPGQAEDPNASMPIPTSADRTESTRGWARAGIGAAGIAAFLLLASVFDPDPSSAYDHHVPGVADTSPRRTAEVVDHLLSRPHPRGWPNLGILQGMDYFVLVHGSPNGPRYTVCSRLGEVLESDLAADEVYRSFPELDIPGMRLDPDAGAASSPMMLAEPAR